MSLEIDGVWKTGVWATTVWASGVWREGLYSVIAKYRGFISNVNRLGLR